MLKTQLMMDSARAKRRADQKPVTEKPGTRVAASRTRSALMTREKSPRVRMVMGNVRAKRTGRIRRFSAASTTARMSAPVRVTVEPGTRYAAIPMVIAETNQCKKIFMGSLYQVVGEKSVGKCKSFTSRGCVVATARITGEAMTSLGKGRLHKWLVCDSECIGDHMSVLRKDVRISPTPHEELGGMEVACPAEERRHDIATVEGDCGGKGERRVCEVGGTTAHTKADSRNLPFRHTLLHEPVIGGLEVSDEARIGN